MTGEVAYQGAPGAFSAEACRHFLPDYEAVAKPSFEAVAQAVVAGESDYGMLPGENSIAGPVPGVQELIATNGLIVRGSFHYPVRLHLMARPGATLAEIEVAVSHPMALAQCAATLRRLCLTVEEATNTAFAAQSVAASPDRKRAAIASEVSAATYGLTILCRDVHDRPDNVTTFLVVAREDGETR
ncbi:MAG: prephenate dehydratase domain-containing protein [Allosphingosinicella sp.]